MKQFTLILLALSLTIPAFAGFPSIEGQLVDSFGDPNLETDVDFRIRIYDVGDTCMLSEEVFDNGGSGYDLSASKGSFALALDGSGNAVTYAGSYSSYQDVFNADPAGSINGCVAIPVGQERKIDVAYSLDSGSTWNSIATPMVYGGAGSAATLNGLNESNFVQVVNNVTQADLDHIMGALFPVPADNTYALQLSGGTYSLVPAAGGGTVTSVAAGTGLTGGTITGAGTLSVDVGTGAGQILQFGTANTLPAVSGANLTNLDAADLTGTLPALNGNALTNLNSGSLSGALPALDGNALTNLNSGSLSGALPALDGSALTNLPGPAANSVLSSTINDGAVATADLADDSVTLAKMNLNSCAVGQVLKINAGGTAWECAVDNNSGGIGDFLANGTIPMTGSLTINATNELRLADADSSNYVGFVSPATVAGNQVWVLPAADGSANEILQTDGSGNLSWVAPPSAPITTVFGRTGTVMAAAGDYDANQIDNTAAGNIAATDVQAAINELDTEKLALAGGTMTGDILMSNEGEVRYADTVGGEYAAIKAPNDLAANYTLTLPVDDGGSGEVLQTDGVGNLSWVALGGGGDFMANGSIPMAGNIDLNSNNLNNVTQINGESTANLMIEAGATRDLHLRTNGTDRLIISSAGVSTFNGNVNLGTGVDLTMGATGQILANGATAGAPSVAFAGDPNTGIYSPAADVIAFTNGGAPSMFIDAGGNVGIGTMAPAESLHIENGKLLVGPLGVSPGQTGQVSLKELVGNGGDAITIRAPDAVDAGGYNFVLPANDGAANQVLQTDGSGVLSWVAQAGGATDIDGLSNASTSNGTASLFLGSAGAGTGANNTAVGISAGTGISSGADNTFIGHDAGNSTTSGSRNILIGKGVLASSPTISDELNIGNTIFGKINTGSVGIGVSNPAEKLHISDSGSNTNVLLLENANSTSQTILDIKNFTGTPGSDNDAARINLWRSNDGSWGNVAVNAGNKIGSITARANDGTDFNSAASMDFVANEAHTATNKGTDVVFHVARRTQASVTEALRISHDGIKFANMPNAVCSVVADRGNVRWNDAAGFMEICNGTAWQAISAGGLYGPAAGQNPGTGGTWTLVGGNSGQASAFFIRDADESGTGSNDNFSVSGEDTCRTFVHPQRGEAHMCSARELTKACLIGGAGFMNNVTYVTSNKIGTNVNMALAVSNNGGGVADCQMNVTQNTTLGGPFPFKCCTD